MPNISAPEIILLLVVALLLFGAKRLPEIGRSLGTGMREFKDSVSGNSKTEFTEVSHTEPTQTSQLPVGTQDTTAPAPAARERNRLLRPHAFDPSPASPRARRGGDARRASRGAAAAALRLHRRGLRRIRRRVHLPPRPDQAADARAAEGAPRADHAHDRRAVHDLDVAEPLRRLPRRAARDHLAGVGVLPAGVRGITRADAAAVRLHRDGCCSWSASASATTSRCPRPRTSSPTTTASSTTS